MSKARHQPTETSLPSTTSTTSPTGSLRNHRRVEEINDRLRGSIREQPPEGWRTHLPDDEILADMTKHQRQVYCSVEVHGIAPSELARMTQSDPSTIRTLLAKARAAAEGRR